MNEAYKQIQEIVERAKHIVVLQADNPDGDSLASALALEAILEDLGKQVTMVCGIDMPSHLKYLSGWDRVEKDIPGTFDACILVDASTQTLLATLEQNGRLGWLKAKPFIVLDHHHTTEGLSFATVTVNQQAVATGEVIYELSTALQWNMPLDAKKFIAVSIMSDSMGLTSEGTTVASIRYLADMVESGVSLAELDTARRELMKKEPELLAYKGALLQRIEFFDENRIATITIPWPEIERYSMMYNPSMLVIDDMRLTIGVGVAIAFKVYNSGRLTAKIRCNSGSHIADKIAEHFGGGGHAYAAGFKINNAPNPEAIKKDVVTYAAQLLKEHTNAV